VGVRHFVAGDDDSDTLAIKGSPLGDTDPVGDVEEMSEQSRRRVDPVIDLLDRHHEDVSAGQGIDRHERHAAIITMDERARNLAGDDATEDRGHDDECTLSPMGAEVLAPNRYLTIPNAFTLVRLCCIPLFLYLLFGRDDQIAAAWLLGGLGATDWVDGWLARRLNQTSEFGKMFDPTVDRILFIVAIGGIIVAGVAPLWIAWAIVIREVLLGGTVAIATLFFGMKRFDVTWLGKLATFLLMFAMPGFMLGSSTIFGHTLFQIASYMLAIPGLVLSYYTAFTYIPTIRASLREGRKTAR